MKKLLLIIFLASLAIPSLAQKKLSKKERKIQGYEEVKQLIESGQFGFVAADATTQKGRRVNLTNNANSFAMNKDNVEAKLPYFGVAQIASMNSSAGIEFNGKPEDLSIDYNDKKKKAVIKFKVRSAGESFNCIMTVFWGKGATLSVTSTRRNRISYSGNIRSLG